MTMLILIVVFIALMALGVPVAFSIGISSIVALFTMHVSWEIIPSRLMSGVSNFSLLAIPLYVMAGSIMETGGIAEKLIRFVNSLVRHIRGGIGNTAIVSEIFFSGISGSTSADTAALGSVLIPAMTKYGYKRTDATAIIAGACAMGIMVPPSMSMIVYCGLTDSSAAALFAAGILPALIIALVLMVLVTIHAKRNNIPILKRSSLKEIGSAFIDSLPALFMPVIIFGGILGGIFTATEAGIVAVIYSLIVGIFVYRKIRVKEMLQILKQTVRITGVVLILMSISGLFSYIMTVEHVPQSLVALVEKYHMGPYPFLITIIIVFKLLGMVMDEMALMVMLVPIIMPVAHQLGIDPIHLGILVIGTVGVGLFVPPVGSAFVVACAVGKVKMEEVVKPLLLYLGVIFAMLLLIAAFPSITLIVPKIFLGYGS
jgi:tripartite ATP-independent transporter DctM subunit